jgi:FtsH-binding integral membrane protein
VPTYQETDASRAYPVSGVRDSAVFGQTMGLVAITVAFAAGGAYLGRNLGSGTGLILFLAAFGAIFGLNVAIQRSEQLAIALLFGVGLLLGLAIGPVVAGYASTDPAVVWQAAGATGLTVAGLGSYGYATRRDFSSWGRTLFWLLLGLIVVGIVFLFVSIPGQNIIWSVLTLVLFGAYTIYDFNRLQRASIKAAPLLAASIFLDVFNIFLAFLSLFGGGGRR